MYFQLRSCQKISVLKRDPNKSESDVKCDLCCTDFNIGNKGKSSIEQHIATSKHQKAMTAASSSKSIKDMFTAKTNYSLSEGVWAYHLVKSNQSFSSSDCASKLIRTCFAIENFHCARTKCEAIVTNVYAPYAEKMLQSELSVRHYICLSTDASNHGNVKLMPIIVRFFGPLIGVKVELLEFSSEKGETSEIISSLIINTAQKNQIVNKIVGFCGDNCATNFGSFEYYEARMRLSTH